MPPILREEQAGVDRRRSGSAPDIVGSQPRAKPNTVSRSASAGQVGVEIFVPVMEPPHADARLLARAFCFWIYAYPAFLMDAAHSSGGIA